MRLNLIITYLLISNNLLASPPLYFYTNSDGITTCIRKDCSEVMASELKNYNLKN